MKSSIIIKISFILVIILSTAINGQSQNCSTPPDCLINPNLTANQNGELGRNGQTTNGWYPAVGTPDVNQTNGHNGSTSVTMWAEPDGRGEGMFACYNFEKNKKYRLCLWIKNLNCHDDGKLIIKIANGAPAVLGTPASFWVPPSTTSEQLIDDNHINSTSWKKLTVDFTADDDYSQLIFYAESQFGWGTSNCFPDKYKIRVSKITLFERPSNQNITVKCGDDLELIGLPSCVSIKWYDPNNNLIPKQGPFTNDITIENVNFSNAGQYKMVINEDGDCSHTVNVNVIIEPDLPLSYSMLVQCNEDITLTAPTAPCLQSVKWKDPNGELIGSGTQIIPGALPENAGTYTMEVTFNGQTYNIPIYIAIECECSDAIPDFTFGNTVNQPVYFNDNFTGVGTSVSWHWDFGDGNTSNDPSPNHSYSGPGDYTVCLNVIRKYNGEVCCMEICKEVSIGMDPPGDLVAPTGFDETYLKEYDNAIYFKDKTPHKSLLREYSWDFGDGGFSTQKNPAHIYAKEGIYNVCLYVTEHKYDKKGEYIGDEQNKYCHKVKVENTIRNK